MRVLIIAAVFACASAAPSGLLAAPYAAPALVAHAAPLAAVLPTISSGDIQAAAIDTHVEAADNARAALDAGQQYHDQAVELHGRAVNAAEENGWKAVDVVKTVEAQLDGAAAGAAPVLAKSLVRTPTVVATPAAYAAAPVAYSAAPAYVAAVPAVYAAPAAYAAAPVATAYATAPYFKSPLLAQAW